MPPWVFDVVVIGVIVLSTVMSIGRGLVREAFSVIAFACGAVAGVLCVQFLGPPFKDAISPNEESLLATVLPFLLGFLVVYVIAAFLGQRMAKLIHAAPEIGALDRIAGAGFGLLRGVLAAILAVLLIHLTVKRGEEPPEIAKSYTYPYLESAADWTGGGLTGVIEFFTGPRKPAAAAEATQ